MKKGDNTINRRANTVSIRGESLVFSGVSGERIEEHRLLKNADSDACLKYDVQRVPVNWMWDAGYGCDRLRRSRGSPFVQFLFTILWGCGVLLKR